MAADQDPLRPHLLVQIFLSAEQNVICVAADAGKSQSGQFLFDPPALFANDAPPFLHVLPILQRRQSGFLRQT